MTFISFPSLATKDRGSGASAFVVWMLGAIGLGCGIFCWYHLTHTAVVSGSDFIQDYIASHALRNGVSVYGADFDKLEHQLLGTTEHENFHLPTTAIVALPYSFLPLEKALWLWSLTNLLLYSSAITLFCSRLGFTQRATVILLGAGILWYPFLHQTGVANVSVFLAVLLWLSWGSLSKEREAVSGIFLGFAGLLKLFPLLLIFFLITSRKYRTSLYALATFCGGAALFGITSNSWDWLLYFTERADQNVKQWLLFPVIQSIPALAVSLIGSSFSNEFSNALLQIDSLWTILAAVCSLLLLMVGHLLRLLRCPHHARFGLPLVILLGSVPIMWSHLYIVFVPLILLLIRSYPDFHSKEKVLFLLSLLFLSLPDLFIAKELALFESHSSFVGLKMLLLRLPLLGTYVLGFLIVRFCRKRTL